MLFLKKKCLWKYYSRSIAFSQDRQHWGWRLLSPQVSHCLAKRCEFKLIFIRPAQDIISKLLTPTKAVWKTESAAGPCAIVMGIETVKFCWRSPVEGRGGNCGLKGPLKRIVPNASPGGRQTEFVVVHDPIATQSSMYGVKVSYKINVSAV